MTNHQLCNQDSGNTEWLTPPAIIEAAREVMGSIQLDPASSDIANQIVKAALYYTKDTIDGLTETWPATTAWLNHPFAKGEEICGSECTRKTCKDRGYHCTQRVPSNAEWIRKLISEYQTGSLQQSCNICFAATSEEWFRPLLAYPQCFLHGRTNYLDPVTLKPVKGVTKGSVVTYLGPNVERFAQVFSRLGTVKVAISPH